MLDSRKIGVFVLLSVVMHAGFVLLFRNVTLSFSPPEAKNLSLTILVRGPGKGEIIQNEAAWPTPGRIEPPFPAQEALTRMSGDAQEWMRVGVPGAPYFTVKETLVPQLDIAALADMAYSEPQDAFAQAPPESKAMPITEFALGPAFPTIFDE